MEEYIKGSLILIKGRQDITRDPALEEYLNPDQIFHKLKKKDGIGSRLESMLPMVVHLQLPTLLLILQLLLLINWELVVILPILFRG